ncbi:hypothetical protein Droror1_Dr00015084 [Drosera rotundifolia]
MSTHTTQIPTSQPPLLSPPPPLPSTPVTAAIIGNHLFLAGRPPLSPIHLPSASPTPPRTQSIRRHSFQPPSSLPNTVPPLSTAVVLSWRPAVLFSFGLTFPSSSNSDLNPRNNQSIILQNSS